MCVTRLRDTLFASPARDSPARKAMAASGLAARVAGLKNVETRLTSESRDKPACCWGGKRVSARIGLGFHGDVVVMRLGWEAGRARSVCVGTETRDRPSAAACPRESAGNWPDSTDEDEKPETRWTALGSPPVPPSPRAVSETQFRPPGSVLESRPGSLLASAAARTGLRSR